MIVQAYQRGVAAAFEKFALDFGALKHIVRPGMLENAALAALPGAGIGALTGALTAGEGRRMEGMGRGALGGGLGGAAGSLLGQAVGHGLGDAQYLKDVQARAAAQVAGQRIPEFAQNWRADAPQWGALGGAALGGAAGGAAGAATVPEQSLWDKIVSKVGTFAPLPRGIAAPLVPEAEKKKREADEHNTHTMLELSEMML